MSDIFKSGFEQKYGCLWIEKIDHDLVEEFKGVACPAQGKCFPVSSLAELPKDVIWWSNIPAAACWSYGRFKSLKADHFMGLSLSEVVLQFCKNKDEVPMVLERLADVFQRMARFMASKTNKGQALQLSEGKLADHFYLPISTPPDLEHEIAARSYLPEFVIKEFEKDKIRLTFTLPVLPRVRALQGMQMPAGPWHVYKSNKTDAEGKQEGPELAALLNRPEPFMAKVKKIHFQNHDQSYLLDRLNNHQINRNFKSLYWLTRPELEILAAGADVELEAAYIGSGYEGASWQLDSMGPLQDWSLLAQFHAQSQWLAHASPCRHPVSRTAQPFTIAMSWMQAHQRNQMFPLAQGFTGAGFKVHSYGNGKISVWCSKNEALKLGQMAYKMGLIVPMFLLKEFPAPQKFDVGFGMDQECIQFVLLDHLFKKHNLWLELDKLVMPELGDKVGEQLKEISQKLLGLKEHLDNGGSRVLSTFLADQARQAVTYLKGR